MMDNILKEIVNAYNNGVNIDGIEIDYVFDEEIGDEVEVYWMDSSNYVADYIQKHI